MDLLQLISYWKPDLANFDKLQLMVYILPLPFCLVPSAGGYIYYIYVLKIGIFPRMLNQIWRTVDQMKMFKQCWRLWQWVWTSHSGDRCTGQVFGSFPSVASDLDRLLRQVIDQGADWRTFSTRCNQNVCSKQLSRVHSKYFKCSQKELLCGADPSISPVHRYLNVIDNIQRSKSFTPGSLWWFFKGLFWGDLVKQ